MTTGWPQDQQNLRWPNADNDDTGPASSVRGRLATETDPGSTAAGDGSGFGSAHPSGPLPVGRLRDPQQRGRLGRKSRARRDEFGPDDAAAGDADYDWIKYLGEARPAQESSRRPADGRDPASADDASGGLRGAGRRLSRRHAAPASQPDAGVPAPTASAAPAPVVSPGPPAPVSSTPAAPPRGAASPDAAVTWPGQKSKSRFDARADTNPTGRLAPADPPQRDTRSDNATRVRPGQPGPERVRQDRRGHEGLTAADTADRTRSGPWDDPRSRGTEPGRRGTAAPQPGLAWPATVRPERTQPESAWPERVRPETAWPESARPQSVWPESTRPGPAPSEISRPEISRPGIGRPEIGRPEIARPDQTMSTRPRQERGAPAADAKTPPPPRHRSHRATSGETRRADTATSSVADAWATDVGSRRPGLAGAGRPAAGTRAPDHDVQRDLTPAKRAGRDKAPRPPKQDRKARRNAGLPSIGQTSNLSPSASGTDVLPVSADAFSPDAFSVAPKSLAPRTAAPKSLAPRTSTRSDRRPARRMVRHPVHLIIGGGVVVILALVAVLVTNMMGGSGAAHSISTPSRLGAYVLQPQLAQSMGAAALRADIVQKGNGEATNVRDAVYEISSGPAAKSGPLFVLFIGGNLAGSASSFISSFKGLLPGAFVTSPGSMGGQAACVPGYSGHPAECAWADNDTFGLFASPDLSAAALGNQLRTMRPLVEHARK